MSSDAERKTCVMERASDSATHDIPEDDNDYSFTPMPSSPSWHGEGRPLAAQRRSTETHISIPVTTLTTPLPPETPTVTTNPPSSIHPSTLFPLVPQNRVVHCESEERESGTDKSDAVMNELEPMSNDSGHDDHEEGNKE